MSGRPPVQRAQPSPVVVAHSPRHARRVTAYACFLLAAAGLMFVVLVRRGAAVPSTGLCLLLAVPLAVCMNRFVVFSNEVGATAEAAVMFAAIVLFRDDALFLGPLLLALLVGPLDARHWERRSFARMAFNSGSQGLTTLVGVAVFAAAVDMLGSSSSATVIGIAAATVPYVFMETVLGVLLAALWGERAPDALRQQLPINCLAFPLALYGVAAAIVGESIGWWFTLGVLVPVPLVPELVLVRARRHGRDLGAATLLAVGVVVIGGTALFVSVPVREPITLGALLVCAVLLGLEVRAVVATPVPPVIGLLVAAALHGGGGNGVLLTVPAVAAAATASAWWVSGSTPRAWRGAALAGCVALALAQVWRVFDGGGVTGPRAWVGVVGAAAAFQLAAVILSRERRDELARALWVAPLVVTCAALAAAAHALDGVGGIAVLAIGMTGALASVAAAGAPPWRSRVLGLRLARVPRRLAARVMVVLSMLAVAAALAAISAGTTSVWWWLAPVAIGEAVVTIALVRARQWRFEPGARSRAVALSAAAAVALMALVSVPGALRVT